MGAAEGLLKRYSRVAAKPIVLALLFYVTVIWLCFFFWFSLSYDPRSMFLDPHWPLEIKAQELERVENFGSFLNSILQWDFGRSFSLGAHSVMPELSWRISNTLILIGFSTGGAILAGAVIALVAFIHKPKKRRPLTFAHSLKCFLFGLTPLIALILTDMFCYRLNLAPRSGLLSIPPPTPGSASWYLDVLAHLFMPVLTLTLVNAIRSAMIIWSGSSSLDPKSPWKIFLLSATTVDFTFMVSAAIFVESIFNIPGVGQYFIYRLVNGDLNAVIGSFVALLAIAVGLGLVSSLLDLLQVGTGIREDLEKPSPQRSEVEMQPNKRSQTKNKLTIVFRRKGLIVGLLLVSFFIVLAIAAPFLTPHLAQRVASRFAMPQWMTIFPPYKHLPPTLTYYLQDMNITEKPSSVEVTKFDEGFIFNYSGKESASVVLSQEIDYQYMPCPKEFRFDLHYASDVKPIESSSYSFELLLKTEEENEIWEENICNPTTASLGFKKFSTSAESLSWEVTSVSFSTRKWLYSKWSDGCQYPRSEMWKYLSPSLDPACVLFSKTGKCTLILNMSFNPPLLPSGREGRCTLNLKNGRFRIMGSVHGILGTDAFGDDVWTELVYSARTTVVASFSIAALAVILGLPFGILAGRFKGWTDNIVMLAAETFLSIPIVPLLLICAGFSSSSIEWLQILCLPEWVPILLWFFPVIAMIAFRNVYLTSPRNNKSTRSEAFALLKYSLANFCLTAISASLILTGTESLGFGDPRIPSWGRMLHRAQGTYAFHALAWWTYMVPIGCVLLFTSGLFLIGSSLDEAQHDERS